MRRKSDGSVVRAELGDKTKYSECCTPTFTETYILMGVQHYKLEKRNKGRIGIRKETEVEVKNALECKNYE